MSDLRRLLSDPRDLEDRLRERSLFPLHLTSFSREFQAHLERIESDAFPPELRYTEEEAQAHARLAGFEAIVLTDEKTHDAVAVMIINRRPDDSPPSVAGDMAEVGARTPVAAGVYLDVLAVRTPGRGLGSLLLGFLIERCRLAGVRTVELDAADTVAAPTAGADLVTFYHRFGFEVVDREIEKGNLRMRLELAPTARGCECPPSDLRPIEEGSLFG